MDFNLTLNTNNRDVVDTDAYLTPERVAQAKALAARGRSAAKGAASRAQGASKAGAKVAAGNIKTGASAAAVRARAAGAEAIALGGKKMTDLREFKRKWHNWLYNEPGKTNFFLLITNVLYLGLTLAILILTLLVLDEHAVDFKQNEYSKHWVDGLPRQYPPCGMPTPDSMYLLQAFGALPASGFDGASLEPDYKNWMKKVDRALCSRIVPSVQLPYKGPDLDLCPADDTGYGGLHFQELLALGYLMEDASITPTFTDNEVPAKITLKNDLFERRACLEDKNANDEKPFYTKQQREAYGDLKTRVARAYVAAMPAFARYENLGLLCRAGADYKDPFDETCVHSCHLRKELTRASGEANLMYDVNAVIPDETTFTKQVYRLLALSLAGYTDRYANSGKCFRNEDAQPAYEFCADSMPSSGAAADVTTSALAVDAYTQQNHRVESSEQCGVGSYPPPPPAPPIARNTFTEAVADSGTQLAPLACAATLQYGLFEQGRLFGIPDVIRPFVVDNRADRHLHFVAEWIYTAMYKEPEKKSADLLSDPKSKLELYIAYRLSSTSIWAILVANVAGYMMVRALAPTGVYILKTVFKFTTNRVASTGSDGEKIYAPILLVRPKLGWPVALAQGVNLLAIYWILWLDPATQSHYYVSTSCEDWRGLGVLVPAGAFGTTWGKRRFARFGEHVIGILLILTFLLVALTAAIGRTFVLDSVVAKATKPGIGSTARMDKVALIMIGLALSIQMLFVTQSILSGDSWYESTRASDNDSALLDTFTKDVVMSVWAAFWTSVSIAWYRQKWAVDNLHKFVQYAWMAGALLLVWMPSLQSRVLLESEVDVAFKDGKGSADTNRMIVLICIYGISALWTVVLAIRLKAMLDGLPDTSANQARAVATVERVREQNRLYLEGAEAAAKAAAQQQDYADAAGFDPFSSPAAHFKFNLGRIRVGPSKSVRFDRSSSSSSRLSATTSAKVVDSVYIPLMPGPLREND
jgi:hypothetical protein